MAKKALEQLLPAALYTKIQTSRAQDELMHKRFGKGKFIRKIELSVGEYAIIMDALGAALNADELGDLDQIDDADQIEQIVEKRNRIYTVYQLLRHIF